METHNITKADCKRGIKDDRLYYGELPLIALCSEPHPSEKEAVADLEKIERRYIDLADGEHKYTMEGIRIWSEAPDSFTAYELFTLSGFKDLSHE